MAVNMPQMRLYLIADDENAYLWPPSHRYAVIVGARFSGFITDDSMMMPGRHDGATHTPGSRCRRRCLALCRFSRSRH